MKPKESSANKRSDRDYADRVKLLHSEDQELLRAFLSDEYRILHGGESSLYTLEIIEDRSKWFLKSTNNRIDREYCFYNLMMRNRIRPGGNYFNFQKIRGIVEVNGRRGYLFDFKTIDKIRYDAVVADKVIRAIAEMNAVNSYSRKLFKTFPYQRKIKLRGISADAATKHILTAKSDVQQTAHARHKAVLETWKFVVETFKNQALCICSNDANIVNCAIDDKKIIFLDMGKAAWAPFGSDLYWIARQARGILSIDQIISRYQIYLRDFGKDISCDHIGFALHACFASKWLNVSENIRSTLNSESYLDALESAEYCLQATQHL